MLNRPVLLLPLLASFLAAPACRSPVPPPPSPEAHALGPTPAGAPSEAPVSQTLPPFLRELEAADPISRAAEQAATEATPLPEAAVEDPKLTLLRVVLAARAPRIEEPVREQLAETLLEAERSSGIPALLLVALIEQESRFDPHASGPRGALGLMQVRPFVGEAVAARMGIPWEGTQTLLDPVLNVRIGTYYLAEQRARFGSAELALAAYNMGPNRLAQRLARGDRGETAFVGRVLQHYEGMQQEFAATETGIGG